MCLSGHLRGSRLYDQEFFELVKPGPKDINRSSKNGLSGQIPVTLDDKFQLL